MRVVCSELVPSATSAASPQPHRLTPTAGDAPVTVPTNHLVHTKCTRSDQESLESTHRTWSAWKNGIMRGPGTPLYLHTFRQR